MTTSGARGPGCRAIRPLLGVYVVGAIEPGERALVDEHLGECEACRDELAGLAGLPAMLSRVPAADVSHLVMPQAEPPEAVPDEILDSLLRRVSAHRQRRFWRLAGAAAAVLIIGAGGTAAAASLTSGSAVPRAAVATAASPGGQVSAVVDYAPAAWGTAMRVQVSGIRPGTTCQFWVVGPDGRTSFAGTWTVAGSSYGYAQNPWYAASATVAARSVHGFQLTVGGKLVLAIPAR